MVGLHAQLQRVLDKLDRMEESYGNVIKKLDKFGERLSELQEEFKSRNKSCKLKEKE